MSYLDPSNYTPQGASAVPSQKKSSAGKIILIVLGLAFLSIVGLVLLVVGAGLFYVWSSETEEVTDADRELVVRAEDLAEKALINVEVDPDGEWIEKTRYFDKTAEVEYEYEHPDEDTPLYLNCSIHEESTLQDARTVYASLQVGMMAGMRLADSSIQQVDRNDLFRWGDDSKCGLLVTGGFNVGNYFFARKGTKIYCLIISGICIEDREALEHLLLPKLQRFEGHKL